MRRLTLMAVLLALASLASAQETTRFFAAAASAQGTGGTFFVTDARIYNPDQSASITVQLSFLLPNVDNTGVAAVPITIGPRQAAALDDLVTTVFATSGSGGVRMRSNRPFLATSRTYNIGDGTSGTFGQYIPGLEPAEALAQGILLQVENDPAASGFRSNIGFLNPTTSTVTVEVNVYNAGTRNLLGTTSRNLPPLAYSQINNVFNAIGLASTVVENATVEFTASAAVFAYASVVDNTSGDPVFVLPFADVGTQGSTNNPPNGTIVSPGGGLVLATGQTQEFVAEVSDPDGDAVTGMEWSFGDGITASGLEVSHIYSEAGTYTVTFTATDSRGLSDPTPATLTVNVVAATATLTQVQAAVFTTSCAFANCHGTSPQRGLSLVAGQTHSNTVNVPSVEQPSLDRIEPGSPEQSYLWRKVTRDPSVTGAFMPIGAPPLNQTQLDLLRSWIEAGAPNN